MVVTPPLNARLMLDLAAKPVFRPDITGDGTDHFVPVGMDEPMDLRRRPYGNAYR